MINSERTVVVSPLAPKAVGPYSQAIKVGNMIFCSGQIPLHPETGDVVGTDVATQTEQVLRNLDAVLRVVDSGLYQVAKTTVYLTNLDDFAEMNAVYGKYFQVDPPARATVEVSRLPKAVLVEIDCIAIVPERASSGGPKIGPGI
jgi:2-iminobutanoate/2-iminopropanoate deaminase